MSSWQNVCWPKSSYRSNSWVRCASGNVFSKIVTQCFDKSFKLDPSCLAPHNDRLLSLQHNSDLMHVGKMCEVVDVQMDVNVVAMLLRCCCHSVERFCTHILLYRKRNCRWANCAIVAMLMPCCCSYHAFSLLEKEVWWWFLTLKTSFVFGGSPNEKINLAQKCRLCLKAMRVNLGVIIQEMEQSNQY